MIGASLHQNGGIANLETLILSNIPQNIEIRHIASHDEGTAIHRIVVFSKAWTSLIWHLLHRKVDVVHIHMSDGGSIIRKALLSMTASLFRKPVVIHTHGAEFHASYNKFPQWLQKLITSTFKHCDAFIVLTSFWREYYIHRLELSRKRVFILPNPTELPDFIPNRMHSVPVRIVFLGRIGERKGAFDLVNAFAKLSKEVRAKTELVLAGDGEFEYGKTLAKKLNVSDQVSFLGWVNTKQRDELLKTADVFILPSYNEGLPLALLEAMGWGLPVITTPVSGIPDVVRHCHNGLLVPPGDIQQISEAIQLMIENEDLRILLGRAARETVVPLDIRVFCERLTDIYQTIL